MLQDYLPQEINSGPWVPAYSLDRLRALPTDTEFVLPICSMATPYRDIMSLGPWLLPSLFREAMNDDLQEQLCQRIMECFPVLGCSRNYERIRIVEMPDAPLPFVPPTQVLAFSVDTAVEEHGPHLPLGTDTIQSYAVLQHLAAQDSQVTLARPLEYGQLTWGLPFGFSIDITAPLLSQYVTGYCRALVKWQQPRALYVVDVHGSISHRQAIVDGIAASEVPRWSFRWLHEPLAEFASQRGDQHAGGVETILVERAGRQLLDPIWWPVRRDQIAAQQMSFEKAVELTPDLQSFCRYVEQARPNGVIGDIRNYDRLNADELFARMVNIARMDVDSLIREHQPDSQQAGKQLW